MLYSFMHLLILYVLYLIILGDFNYPNIDWSTLSGYNLYIFSFCDLIFDLNLVQLIKTLTHTAGNTLDLLLTNNDSVIQNISHYR